MAGANLEETHKIIPGDPRLVVTSTVMLQALG